ncbi:SymE family type I addiction module toxin [Pantoea dispersa]|uniref:Type I addiction module toxin, SymE family n=1 Tax=Pantoea dispersa TaxID=59814 RepID=A0ABY3A0Z3_9GAMM|nr:SymE family type I addiction module toxin [Pantoea dispersa]TQC75910.1 type I addiction module toxin, SymE family [Pantoea dispersa]
MADTHHKPEPVTPQVPVRKSIVGYRPNGGKPGAVPQILLGGQWLTEEGFTTGTPLDVRVLNGCLIITAEEIPESTQEPEIMQTLRQVCKFSARRQRQVADFIAGISNPQARSGG